MKTLRTLASVTNRSRAKARALGWAKYVCTLEPDEQEPLEVEGYDDAVDSYEVWREAAIQEYDQRRNGQ